MQIDPIVPLDGGKGLIHFGLQIIDISANEQRLWRSGSQHANGRYVGVCIHSSNPANKAAGFTLCRQCDSHLTLASALGAFGAGFHLIEVKHGGALARMQSLCGKVTKVSAFPAGQLEPVLR